MDDMDMCDLLDRARVTLEADMRRTLLLREAPRNARR
jgi:hypothetical protein